MFETIIESINSFLRGKPIAIVANPPVLQPPTDGELRDRANQAIDLQIEIAAVAVQAKQVTKEQAAQRICDRLPDEVKRLLPDADPPQISMAIQAELDRPKDRPAP